MKPGRIQGRDRDGDDPGVPEALPRSLVFVRDEIGAGNIDRLWVFPPLRNGRTERGLVAVSRYLEDGERRRVLTVTYTAERTGLEFQVEPSLSEEGDAPPEMLPRVMEGVVRRAGEDHTEARTVTIDGDPDRFQALLDEFEPGLVEVDTP